MLCPKCGNDIPEGQNFCFICGTDLNAARAAAADPASQPAPEPAPQPAPEPAPQYAPPQPQYAPPQPQYAPPQPQYAPPQPQYAPAQPQYAPAQTQYAPPQYVQPQNAPAQPPYAQSPYGQPAYAPPAYQVNNTVVYNQPAPPARTLATNRKLVKYIFFTILTLGIYHIVFYTNISNSLNTAASRYDGRKTMNYCLVTFVFSWLTFGIVPFVWIIKMSSRVGRELQRRGINYGFNAGTFWLWNVLGSLIIVGPFIYTHKLAVAMNLICKDYNLKG